MLALNGFLGARRVWCSASAFGSAGTLGQAPDWGGAAGLFFA
jgi:hypothetical protein